MRKYLLSITMLLFCTFANAIPSVDQIKAAMQSNNPQLVEKLARQVLAEKPNSAKAHYFLGQAYLHEGNKNAARSEFDIAKGLDPNLSFTNNPQQFYQIYNNTNVISNTTTSRVTTSHHRGGHATHNNSADGFFILYLFIGIIGSILLVALIIALIDLFTKEKEIIYTEVKSDNNYPREGTFSTTYTTPRHSSYTRAPSPPTSGSGATVVNNNNGSGGSNGSSFMNGMVTGMLVDELLHSGHHRDYGYRGYDDSYDSTTTTTTETTSYSSDSSSNWDTGSSGSWDSGSSSSWDSSSSFDSSSSGDW